MILHCLCKVKGMKRSFTKNYPERLTKITKKHKFSCKKSTKFHIDFYHLV